MQEIIPQFAIWMAVWLFSTTVHEASHALLALKGGDPTAYHGGQVSLNPLPHIKRSPAGMVVIPVIMFIFTGGSMMIGWASTPYDPTWAARHPHRAAKMALAGPVSNLILAILALIAYWIGIRSGAFHIGFPQAEFTGTGMTAYLLFVVIFLNLLLFMFNLLPFPPLDGAQIALLFFPEERAHEIGAKINRIGGFGILIALLIINVAFFPFFRLIWSGVLGTAL